MIHSLLEPEFDLADQVPQRIGGRPEPKRVWVWVGWLPVIVLPAAAALLTPLLTPWAAMWLLLAAVFGGCKWLTWCRAIDAAARAPWRQSAAYLVAWPGMDAEAFLDRTRRVRRPGVGEWAEAILKILVGVTLLWGVTRWIPPSEPILAGWVGMIGLAFVSHFGIFHLLALIWQRAGVNAPHIFRAPARATSVSDFWSYRWNMAFRDLAHGLVFRPLVRRLGTAWASFVTFAMSGLVHELVISVPARAGFALPTAYFLIQWLGVLIERSRFGRRLRLRRGFSGWLFAFACTAGPAIILFHPPFLTRVVVPFLSVIGAI